VVLVIGRQDVVDHEETNGVVLIEVGAFEDVALILVDDLEGLSDVVVLEYLSHWQLSLRIYHYSGSLALTLS
jgi:hypothetical protein